MQGELNKYLPLNNEPNPNPVPIKTTPIGSNKCTQCNANATAFIIELTLVACIYFYYTLKTLNHCEGDIAIHFVFEYL